MKLTDEQRYKLVAKINAIFSELDETNFGIKVNKKHSHTHQVDDFFSDSWGISKNKLYDEGATDSTQFLSCAANIIFMEKNWILKIEYDEDADDAISKFQELENEYLEMEAMLEGPNLICTLINIQEKLIQFEKNEQRLLNEINFLKTEIALIKETASINMMNKSGIDQEEKKQNGYGLFKKINS